MFPDHETCHDCLKCAEFGFSTVLPTVRRLLQLRDSSQCRPEFLLPVAFTIEAYAISASLKPYVARLPGFYTIIVLLMMASTLYFLWWVCANRNVMLVWSKICMQMMSYITIKEQNILPRYWSTLTSLMDSNLKSISEKRVDKFRLKRKCASIYSKARRRRSHIGFNHYFIQN